MKKLAVFGLLEKRLIGSIRSHQKRLSDITGDWRALRFPVHITLRGPFWTSPDSASDLMALVELACRGIHRVPLELEGPIFTEPDLCWLELKRSHPGFSELLRLHMMLEDALQPLILRDDVPPAYKAERYRPHVTLGWSTGPGICCPKEPAPQLLQLTGAIDRIALALYPDTWPARGMVRAIRYILL